MTLRLTLSFRNVFFFALILFLIFVVVRTRFLYSFGFGFLIVHTDNSKWLLFAPLQSSKDRFNTIFTLISDVSCNQKYINIESVREFTTHLSFVCLSVSSSTFFLTLTTFGQSKEKNVFRAIKNLTRNVSMPKLSF